MVDFFVIMSQIQDAQFHLMVYQVI